MKHSEETREMESVIRIYEDIPLSDSIGRVGAILERGLANPTIKPWLEVSLVGLNQLASAYPQTLGKAQALIRTAVDRSTVQKHAIEIEKELAKGRGWLPFYMPMGTRFDDEEYLDPESKIAQILGATRNWYKVQMQELGVENPVFSSQATFFTLPEDDSRRSQLVILGKTVPINKIDDVVAEGLATLEEGLALYWSERFRTEVLSQMFPNGHNFYQKTVEEIVTKHPELNGTRLFIRPDKLEPGKDEDSRSFDVSVNDYSFGREVVSMLMGDIPNFLALAEQARINGKTLALARVVEQQYGLGSYRKFVTGKFSVANFKRPVVLNNETQEMPENHLAGMAYGSSIFIDVTDIDPKLPEYLNQLMLYQIGMVTAEEIYHSLAPVMVHLNTNSYSELDYRVERRGLNYSTKDSS